MRAPPPRRSNGRMSNSSRGSSRADRVTSAISVLAVVCVVLCVIAGFAVLGWFVFAGMAMSRYGSNK